MQKKKDQRATITVDMDCTGSHVEILRGKFAKRVSRLDNFLEGGYTEAARERVKLFAEYLRKGDPIPREHFLKFCDQLDRIAAGENPLAVLGLKKRKGKAPDIERLHRLNEIAYRIWRKTLSGKTVESAIEEFASSPEWPKLNGHEAQSEESRYREAQLAWETHGKSHRALETSGEQGLPNLKPLKRKK